MEQGDIFRQVAERLNPALKEELSLTPAWRWKIKFDACVNHRGEVIDREKWNALKTSLYQELGHAPGEAIYVPGPTQSAAHVASEATKQFVGGWRAGKSKWLAAELLPFLFIDNSHVWNVANTYELARAEFDYIKDWLIYLGANIKISLPQTGRYRLKILDWNAVLETKTADDITGIEMANLNAAGIAEAGQIAEDVLHRLHGRTMEKGGNVALAGSLESALSWYLKRYGAHMNGGENWRSFGMPSWENSVIFPGGRQDPKIIAKEQELPEDLFRLKVGAELVRAPELVFPQFDPTRNVVEIKWADYEDDQKVVIPVPKRDAFHKEVSFTLPPGKAVELAVDPGYSNQYAVLALQKFGDQVFAIDEIYKQGMVVEDIIEMCKQRWWWKHVTSGTIDIAGTAHQGMKSHVEIWREKGNVHLSSMPVGIVDGIQRLRTFILDPATKKPRLWVSPKCEGLINEFDLYRYREAKEMRPQREEPIDTDNHSIKALSYWLVSRYGFLSASSGRVTSVKYIKDSPQWTSGGFNPLREERY